MKSQNAFYVPKILSQINQLYEHLYIVHHLIIVLKTFIVLKC